MLVLRKSGKALASLMTRVYNGHQHIVATPVLEEDEACRQRREEDEYERMEELHRMQLSEGDQR